ncbi:MAG: sulfotransferase [Solirubrobacterales bacterium]
MPGPTVVHGEPGIIATGMHRSGTSLLGQTLASFGFFLGPDLVPAERPNPRGFFEERSIVKLHAAALRENGTRALDPAMLRARPPRMTPERAEEAATLMRDTFGDRSRWAWKDPRASLFLPFWKSMVPQARFVFAVRDPALVAWSLLRRGDRLGVVGPRLRPIRASMKAWAALNAWWEYNRRIAVFAAANPERVAVLMTPHDLRETSRLERVLAGWGFDLDQAGVEARPFEENLLTSSPPGWLRVLAAGRPEIQRLHRQLAALRGS